jgi:hypothetical protein
MTTRSGCLEVATCILPQRNCCREHPHERWIAVHTATYGQRAASREIPVRHEFEWFVFGDTDAAGIVEAPLFRTSNRKTKALEFSYHDFGHKIHVLIDTRSTLDCWNGAPMIIDRQRFGR